MGAGDAASSPSVLEGAADEVGGVARLPVGGVELAGGPDGEAASLPEPTVGMGVGSGAVALPEVGEAPVGADAAGAQAATRVAAATRSTAARIPPFSPIGA